jgi:hypothetical protein
VQRAARRPGAGPRRPQVARRPAPRGGRVWHKGRAGRRAGGAAVGEKVEQQRALGVVAPGAAARGGHAREDFSQTLADTPHYDVIKETNIQDLLFLENRDRKYDSSIYSVRGIYNVQNLDFNLSQFGLFIDNDTIFMTVHINDWITSIGRKPISGDVFELPHLKDEFALNDYSVALPRYFVIEDVSRASEGFSITWYPHLYRLKLKKITKNKFNKMKIAYNLKKI